MNSSNHAPKQGRRQPRTPAKLSPIKKPDYAMYESLKRQLPDDLTHDEYQRRVLEIAKRCGV